MHVRTRLRVGLLPFLAFAVAGCGRSGNGSSTGSGAVVVAVDSGSSGGGTDPGTLGSGVPDENASDCGCDGPASDDASDGTGDGTSGSGDAGSGGLGSDGASGDGSGDLRGLAPERHWLAAGSPGSSDAVTPRCIHGLVEDDSGRPIEGAGVSAALGGADLQPATTTGAGHFCLKGTLAGTATIAVTAPDGSQVAQRIDAAAQPLDAHGCVPVRTVFPSSP